MTNPYCDQIKFCKEQHPKSCRRFQIDKSCKFGISCAYLHPDYSEEGNKKITNKIIVNLENLEKATKEGMDQLKASAQQLSEKILTLEAKLAHSKEDKVVKVIEKVKHTEKQDIDEVPNMS